MDMNYGTMLHNMKHLASFTVFVALLISLPFVRAAVLTIASSGSDPANTDIGFCCAQTGQQCGKTLTTLRKCVDNRKGIFFRTGSAVSSLSPDEKEKDWNQCNVQACRYSKTCCLCQYMDDDPLNLCAVLPKESCTDNAELDISCIWSTEKNSCVKRFVQGCDDWLSAPEQNDCKTKLKTNENVKISQEPIKSFVANCTSVRWFRRGHSGPQECKVFAETAQVCLECVGSSCTNIQMVNAGCQTFKKVKLATSLMKRIQQTLRPGQHLDVSANQAPSNVNEKCTTYVTYHMTIDKISIEFEKCHSGNAFCFQEPRPKPVKCTDESGNKAKEICCPPGENGGKWVRGTVCPK